MYPAAIDHPKSLRTGSIEFNDGHISWFLNQNRKWPLLQVYLVPCFWHWWRSRIHVHQMHTLHGGDGFYHWLMWFNFFNKLRAGREFYAWRWWVCHWLMWYYFSSKLRADGEFYAVILLSLSCFMFGTPACLSLLYREVTLHQLYYGQYRPDCDLQDARIWSFNRVLRGLD